MRPEDILQEKYCKILDLIGLPYYAIPNGANQTKAAAIVLKRTGLKRGVPDLHIPVPVYAPLGLNQAPQIKYLTTYIETKTRGKYPPPEQRSWHKRLREEGHRVEVVKSPEQFIELLCILYPTYISKIPYFASFSDKSRYAIK